MYICKATKYIGLIGKSWGHCGARILSTVYWLYSTEPTI